MAVTWRTTGFAVFNKMFGHELLRNLGGALAHGKPIGTPLTPEEMADITYESQLQIGKVPASPVLRLNEKQYVDDFFQNGILRLGTIEYYRRHEHPEIGDVQEGTAVVIGQARRSTIAAYLEGGFNQYMLCATVGDNDLALVAQRFPSYDAGIYIQDVVGFHAAIASVLQSKRGNFGRCLYRNVKVVVGFQNAAFHAAFQNGQNISMLAAIASDAKYFIKPYRFLPQQEFRFTWEVDSDVVEPIIIRCPQAISFCRRFDLTDNRV